MKTLTTGKNTKKQKAPKIKKKNFFLFSSGENINKNNKNKKNSKNYELFSAYFLN